MDFNGQTRMKDIALSNPAARQVLEDAGLDYCCRGGKSLHEACLDANVSHEEILSRLRERAQPAAVNDVNWMTSPLSGLTRHIRETHHRYVREAISRTQALAEKVASKHGSKYPGLADIGTLFAEVGGELTIHMHKEERILFPYIEAMEQAAKRGRSMEPPFFQTVRNPIHALMADHDTAGELVRRIRGLTSEYTPPADACASFQALYQALREFESDLHLHVHLENNVLFPRAVELEAALT